MNNSYLDDIKHNCEISDARFWGFFSICGLLMRYRDLYRAEQGLEPWSSMPREAVSAWIAAKESRWPELEDQEFRRLAIEGREYDPFDSPAVNAVLVPQGYVYGAGYGMYNKPTFVLARLTSAADVEGHRVYTTGREIVRDLFSAPAMLQEQTIYLRLDPLKALLWDAYCRLRPGHPSPLAEAFGAAGIRTGQALDDAFARDMERMGSSYAEVLLAHELAESKEGVPGWKDLLASSGDRKTELALRAIKDLIADTSDAGPLARIAARRDRAQLALLLGLLDGFRRVFFPEIREAYARFQEQQDWAVIEDVRRNGYERFLGLRSTLLDLFASGGADALRRGVQERLQVLT